MKFKIKENDSDDEEEKATKTPRKYAPSK